MNARQLDYFRQKLADEINRLVLNETAVKVRVQDHSEVRPDIIDRAVHCVLILLTGPFMRSSLHLPCIFANGRDCSAGKSSMRCAE